MSFVYQIYGLQLAANRQIVGLQPAASLAQDQCFNVWLGVAAPWTHGDGAGLPDFSACSSRHSDGGAPTWTLRQPLVGRFELDYADGTRFAIDLTGRNIWATWPNSLTLEDTVTYLVGPVLGFVLRSVGTTCLHASAVAIDGRAILFAGHPGAGKSTAAAAFAERGFAVLADDIVALSERSRETYVEPGYPRVNLWADSATALFGSATALPRVTPTWDKLYRDLAKNGARFHCRRLALGNIYIIGDRSDDPLAPYVEPLSAREQLMALIGNTYANNLLDRRRRADEFAHLGDLVVSVSVRRVVPHSDFRRLPSFCRLILDDLDSAPPIPLRDPAQVRYEPV